MSGAALFWEVEKRECFLTCSIALGASLVGVSTSEYILRALPWEPILSLCLSPAPPHMFLSASLQDKPAEDPSLCRANNS